MTDKTVEHSPLPSAEDLIDAGLIPRTVDVLESPIERAVQSLMDAVGDIDVAMWTAPTKEDVLQFCDTIETAIRKLTAQSVAAQAIAQHWDERGNK